MKRNFRVISLLVLCVMLIPVTLNAKSRKKAEVKSLSTLEMIEKVNRHWQSVTSPDVRAFWDHAAYFTGNMEAYKLTGDPAFLEYSDKWCRYNHWMGATEPNQSKWLYKTYGEGSQYVLFGDWQICFQTYLDMYQMNPDEYKIKRAKEVMDKECAMEDNGFWWWADALYMVMPVMTKMYKATGDVKYLDKLYDNFMFADNLMFDKDEHLYYRDGKYIYPAHKTDNGKKDFWARGDGWVLAGLAKVLQDMPKDYKHRDFFVERFSQLAAAVAKCQQPQGYWTRSMLDRKQADGPETSGTAFFTYGLLWGMNNGLLDKVTYQPVTDKAWKYLSTKALQADGSIGFVQPIGEKAIPGQQLDAKATSNFGVGAFLLAACEKVRFDDKSVNPTDSKSFDVTVTNNTNVQGQQVIELDSKTVYSKLSISGGRQFVVTNALGREVPYQLTYDGKVLIEAWVNPLGAASFKIAKGLPAVPANAVYGRMYPERVDDIAWENDRCAYRCYGPALQKSGEDAYGNDVWVKNTPDLVVEQRYYNEDTYKKPIAELRKAGKKEEAQELEDNISYHFDHGHGLDCYKVGPTLGCGTPALMDGDKILFPYCYKNYQILDNGPLRFTVKLVYNPATIKGDTGVVETRILSLDKGSNFNKMTVSYSGLTSPCQLGAGVVIHTEDTASVKLADNYVAYADPTDNPKGQNFQIYVATLFPKGVNLTKKMMYANPTRGNAGHALGITTYKNGDSYTYYFGSAWSKYDCRTFAEWTERITGFMESIKYPLSVTVK